MAPEAPLAIPSPAPRFDRRFLLTGALLACACGAARVGRAAGASGVIGYVDGVVPADAPEGTFVIERGDGSVERRVAARMVLRVDDRIAIAPGGVLRLGLLDRSLELTGPRAATPVDGVTIVAPPDSPVAEALILAAPSAADRAVKRGRNMGRLSLPLVPPSGGSLLAGLRPLSLGWYGGAPPYEVTLLPAEGEAALFAESGLGEPVLPPRSLGMAPGSYRLTIADSRKDKISRKLEVVPEAAEPRMPVDKVPAGVAAEIRTMARAQWLSQQDDGRWRLQAYLALRELPDAFPLGRSLARRLETDG